MNNKTIRKNLEELLSSSMRDSNYERLIEYINNLSAKDPNAIQFIDISDEYSRCYDYAFDTQISHKNAVKALLDNKSIIKEINAYEQGKQIVGIYFIDDQPVHAGKVAEQDIIESKWDRGPIVQHDPLVSPESYGSDIKYFEIIDQVKVKDFLKNYSIT